MRDERAERRAAAQLVEALRARNELAAQNAVMQLPPDQHEPLLRRAIDVLSADGYEMSAETAAKLEELAASGKQLARWLRELADLGASEEGNHD